MTIFEKIVTRFVKELDNELSIVFTDDENEYDYVESCVYFNPNSLEDCGFLRHLREVHGFTDCDKYPLFFWTLLHEIGHHFTIDYCEEDETEVRTLCAMCSNEEAEKSVYIQDLYFNLESEWEATEWAIDFVKTNLALCENFLKKIKKVLDKLN